MSSTPALLYRGLISEFLKHKTTFMLWFVLVVPLIVTITTFLTMWGDNNINVANPWRWYIILNYRAFFHIFVFLQILFIGHINYLEHKNNTWKNLRVLPVPYWTLFFSKFIFGYTMLALSILIFYLFIMLGGSLLGNLRPDLGFQYTSYWLEGFVPSCKFFIASTCIAAIMYWVSYHFRSILVSAVVGLIGYASGFALFLFNSRPGYKGFPYSKWHPFNFPGYAFDSFGTGNHSLNMEFVYYGFAGGTLILLAHYFLSRNKNVE